MKKQIYPFLLGFVCMTDFTPLYASSSVNHYFSEQWNERKCNAGNNNQEQCFQAVLCGTEKAATGRAC